MLIRCPDFENVTPLILAGLYDSFLEATKVVHGGLRRHSPVDWLGKFIHITSLIQTHIRGLKLGGKRAGVTGKQISVAIL